MNTYADHLMGEDRCEFNQTDFAAHVNSHEGTKQNKGSHQASKDIGAQAT
jgi:hypothetical protein